MKLLLSAYNLNVETLQMEKKLWTRENELFRQHELWPQFPNEKLLGLKYIKYFRGRKENPKSTSKKAKSKTKGFFPRKWEASQNAIVHSSSKISITDPLFSLRESKLTLILFPFLWHHPPPLTYIKLNSLTWNMGVVLH